jgi:hypothetical protein
MTEEKRPESEVLDELQNLGEQLVDAVKTLWESEDSRRLRDDIGQGFTDLGQRIEGAISSAKDSEAGHRFEEQVKETVEKARESDVTSKLEEGLVTGLRELSDGLAKLVESMQPAAEAEEEPEAEAGE